LEWNAGWLGGVETAFDCEVEAFIYIMEYITDNQIPGDLTISSDAHATIARFWRTQAGSGQGRAIGVVKSV
jgi:hypothetical protein